MLSVFEAGWVGEGATILFSFWQVFSNVNMRSWHAFLKKVFRNTKLQFCTKFHRTQISVFAAWLRPSEKLKPS